MDQLTAINIKRPILKVHIQKIWVAIILFLTFPFILYAAQLSSLTNYLFPLFDFVLVIVLYSSYPGLYVSHMCCLWFITLEIRRLVDIQIGFQSISPEMLTPYLVMGLTFSSVLLYFPTNQQLGWKPEVYFEGLVSMMMEADLRRMTQHKGNI